MELSRPPLVVTFELSEKRKAIVAHALAGASAVVYLTELEEAARAEALRNTGALLTFNTSKELRSGEARVLNLSRPDLMRRASYKNIAKGLRRLDELLAGELNKTRGLIRALPAALEVPIEVVEHAIEQTRHRIAEARETSRQAREAAWRAAFTPHAIILTERRVPLPIFVAAFIAVERLLRIDFDPVLVPVSYANKAVAGIRSRLSEFTSESVGSPETLPAFGRPIGVIVNYTPDRAVWFDLDGNPVETFTHAHCPADTYIGLRARPVPPATLRAVMLRFTRLPGEL